MPTKASSTEGNSKSTNTRKTTKKTPRNKPAATASKSRSAKSGKSASSAKSTHTSKKSGTKKPAKRSAPAAASDPAPTLAEVMSQLESLGTEQTRKIYRNHGAREMFGVSVANLKQVAKQLRGQQQLACELFETGNVDAQYLAGLVADGRQMNRRQLNDWARRADWYMISEYIVPWLAVENGEAPALASKWIASKKENVASSGWASLAVWVACRPDEELDLKELRSRLKQVEQTIHEAPNRVRYAMNGFVIAVGSHVAPLLKAAMATARRIGKVQVDLGGTSCKVPFAPDYIAKVEQAGRVGRKRKNIKC